MIEVSYNPEENIIYSNRQGEITLQEVLSYIAQIDGEFLAQDELFVLEDYRQSSSNYEKKDLPLIIDEIKKRIGHFKLVKVAIVVDSPSETVLGILYEEIARQVDHYYFRTFSTISSAKSWLTT
jgi:hypothetical protein